MSQLLIQQYRAHHDLLKKVSGTERESVVREAFKDLLKNWGRNTLMRALRSFPRLTVVTRAVVRMNVDIDATL
ncbi:MAG: hypothetical protein HY527_17895 [Betaproteobacteria bacterium]|nr:hypothetical protein [Betaproteobacteria bacterium]